MHSNQTIVRNRPKLGRSCVKKREKSKQIRTIFKINGKKSTFGIQFSTGKPDRDKNHDLNFLFETCFLQKITTNIELC